MKVAELDTILATDDLRGRTRLHCLACRRRLAEASLSERIVSAEETTVTVTIAHLSADLRDFQQHRGRVILSCTCNTRSVYHLL